MGVRREGHAGGDADGVNVTAGMGLGSEAGPARRPSPTRSCRWRPSPTRLFTAQNIGTILVTTTVQASGARFGSDSFESESAKLWGVA